MYFVWRLFFILTLAANGFSPSAAEFNSARYDLHRAPEWAAIDLALRKAWYANDIRGVERVLAAPAVRTTALGEPEFDLAFHTLEMIIATGPYEHPAIATNTAHRLQNWRTAFPGSSLPDLVEAMHLLHHAYRYDADYPGERRTTAGFNRAQSARRDARVLIDRAGKHPETTAYWHALSLRIAIADREPFEALLDRAIVARSASPTYFEPQRLLLTHLVESERWHPINIETLVLTLATYNDGTIDSTIYARAYVHLFDAHFHTALFHRMPVRWERLRGGLETLTEQHPASWLLNTRAAIACLAGDRDETHATFGRIASSIELKLWRLPRFYEECRNWAAEQQERGPL